MEFRGLCPFRMAFPRGVRAVVYVNDIRLSNLFICGVKMRVCVNHSFFFYRTSWPFVSFESGLPAKDVSLRRVMVINSQGGALRV